ncbi:Bug family tripartite tricarboxylate transporter substrate binding protein [Variovorax saccharolyticus]|uniref:Bug family tripartite tricarboxylate transporter substrate binding protein n=1 Tax=Variovorax saccharolyticus TaxID=3053516 RepID=UPI0025760A19|nr:MULTISPECIES: tripartite tricarboxylate transporter substrate binding protein [unclassified Variovorax]MDM0019399.1 tripartite tricarboxylate transporter substrate binding protein [Variovorax sp. J22R187]MDM0026268.1 tripartite tricarboxylate transporter substrate binding protein [Variovorax sp. J31P216]
MKRREFQLALLAATLGRAGLAPAQDRWPDRPVKVVLSQPAGSGPDNVARLLCDGLAQAIGQPVVIDNKPGGQNVIGAQAVARAPADGYTLYFATTAALVTNSYLFKTLPYEPVKDFAPVAFVANSPFAVLVKEDSPIASLPDLVARSAREPGKLSIANEGPRTFGGMIARVINARSKAQANLVSYSSVGVALQNILGGHADAVVADLASTSQLARQGRLRVLSVTTAKRVAGWEQVPTVAEFLPGIEMSGWMAMVAPAGTPQAVVQRLNTEINRLLVQPAIAEKMLAIGPIAAPGGSPAQFEAFLLDEHKRLGQIALEIGLLPE